MLFGQVAVKFTLIPSLFSQQVQQKIGLRGLCGLPGNSITRTTDYPDHPNANANVVMSVVNSFATIEGQSYTFKSRSYVKVTVIVKGQGYGIMKVKAVRSSMSVIGGS